jgi:DNA-directed RNA polymerase specialized sigma subunit
MIFEEMMTSEKPEARQNLKELCYKFTQLKNEYKGGLTPPPKEISQKLGITVEEYSELSQFIVNGGYEDLQRQIISEDFQSGAEFIDNNFY